MRQVLFLVCLGLLLAATDVSAAAKGRNAKTPSKKEGGKDYSEALGKIGEAAEKAQAKADALSDKHMKYVDKDPGSLITKEAMARLVQRNTFLPQKAGTLSIGVQPGQGFNGFTNYQPSDWKITETLSGPTKKEKEKEEEDVPPVTYPMGLGPVLYNQCTGTNYTQTSPCYNSKLFDLKNSMCLKLMDSAAFIGVGFDGRGMFKSDSRKASLVQRVCANKATYMDQDVPDTMNVFGIYDTAAETRSFQSLDQYMRYIRHKAGLSNQKGLFKSEASKYHKASSFGMNLGAIGSIVGGAIGAVAGGPAGASAGAQLGGAIGGTASFGTGSGSGGSSSTDTGSSSSKREQTEKIENQQGSTQNFFAIMYVNIILYEITLDEVKPTDLSLMALKDYMSLPSSYFSVGADVKYQNFLLRYGTHYVRSGKFGGQFKVTKTCKTKKAMSAQQFARIAESEFQSIFATLTSKYSQKSKSGGFLGFSGQSKSSKQSSVAKTEKKYNSKMSAKNENSQNLKQSEFTQTSVEAQGGTPEIAEALIDFYTPSFKQLFHDWVVSIKDYPKPFEFQLKAIDDLFGMSMKDLFPDGNKDFGCGGGKGVKLHVETGTNRRFYIDTQARFVNNKLVKEKVRVYCKFSSMDEFEQSMNGRKISLEKAAAVYMVEGPFPTSSFNLPAGEIGCEEETFGKLISLHKPKDAMKFSDLKSSPFILAFDMPQSIPDIVSMQAKFKMFHRSGVWYAIGPKQTYFHLYQGCYVADDKKDKICFRNIVLTYNEKSGFFFVQPKDFAAAKLRIPSLPNWLSGSTIARPRRLQTVSDLRKKVAAQQTAIPCNVKWLNSHRLDPNREENCIHFTAAAEGDIFVIFAAIPNNHHTWYYLQISRSSVAFYQGMKLQKRDTEAGMGVLGNKNLYQSFFVCVSQKKKSPVIMQYGKADPGSEVGTVYSGFEFPRMNDFARLSFYSFGSGEKAASLMDIRITKQLPKAACLNSDYEKRDGHCMLKCHAECIGCKRANDNMACHSCKHMAVESVVNDKKVLTCFKECPPGKYPSKTKIPLCVACPAGLFKNKSGNLQCTKCAAGTFSATGAKTCTLCSPGAFNSEKGQQKCRKCARGTFSDKKGSVQCTECPVGHFSEIGEHQCQLCHLGHYGNKKGLHRCIPCRPGTYASRQGMTSCQSCPAGSSSASGSRSCDNNCKIGHFSPRKGVACRPCPVGSFTESSGTKVCSKCSKGYYQDRTGQSACKKAPKGSYAFGLGMPKFIKCAAGTFNEKEGQSASSACNACAAGSFSANAGASSCTPCQPGSYQSKPGQTKCQKVAAGHFADTQGLTAQKNCIPGSFSAHPGAKKCSKCPLGHFSSSPGSKECSKCFHGHFSPIIGLSRCLKCPVGNFSPQTGSSSCQKCPAGSFASTVGSTACTKCPAGTYSNGLGSKSCWKCPAGTFAPATGTKKCQKCPAGRYAPSLGSKSCLSCATGHFVSGTGSSRCQKCSAGTFASGTGSSVCRRCPAGQFASSTGSSRCYNCAAGSYASSTGSAACIRCSRGFYQGRSGQTYCHRCNHGMYQPSEGGTTCHNCNRGRYQPYTGRQDCYKCRPGQYQGALGKTYCVKCPAGTYQPHWGGTSCHDCQSNTYQDVAGQPSCKKCPVIFPRNIQPITPTRATKLLHCTAVTGFRRVG